MTIEPKVDANLEGNEDLDLEDDVEGTKEEVEEGKEEKPVEKVKLTPEQQLAIYERKSKKLRKDLGLDSDDKEPKAKATKSGDLDYGALAFHNSKSDSVKIESDEDIEFLKETMEETGKSQKDILASKWFQSELKERAEARRSSDAVPKGTKRTGSSSKDTVEHWLAKGEMPENTPENQELRRKIVAEKIKRATSGSNFASSATGSVTRQSQMKK